MGIKIVTEIEPGWSGIAHLNNEGGGLMVRKIRKMGHDGWSPAVISCSNKVMDSGEALAFAQLMIEAARIAMEWDANPPIKAETEAA